MFECWDGYLEECGNAALSYSKQKMVSRAGFLYVSHFCFKQNNGLRLIDWISWIEKYSFQFCYFDTREKKSFIAPRKIFLTLPTSFLKSKTKIICRAEYNLFCFNIYKVSSSRRPSINHTTHHHTMYVQKYFSTSYDSLEKKKIKIVT